MLAGLVACVALAAGPPGEPAVTRAQQQAHEKLVDQTVAAFRKLNEARNSGSRQKYQQALNAWQVVQRVARQQGNRVIEEMAWQYVQELQAKLRQLPQPLRQFRYDIRRDARPNGGARRRPKKVPRQDWNQFFRSGRTIYSLGLFRTEGQAINQWWVLQGRVWFVHFAQTPVRVKILKQVGNAITLEVSIPEVRETLFISNRELNFNENNIIRFLRDRLLDFILGKASIPEEMLKEIARKLVDKVALRLAQLVGFVPNVKNEFRQAFGSLSGHTFEITYVNGLGVTDLRITEGKNLEEEYFRELARQLTHSALTNYLLRDLALARPGQQKTYNVEELAGMLGFALDVDAYGQVTLERLSDDKQGRAVFRIVRADVTVQTLFAGRNYQARFFVNPQVGNGVVYYRYSKNRPFNLKSWFVEEAYVDWGVNAFAVPPKNLLFGVKAVRNLMVRSYFHAQSSKQIAAGNK